MLARIFQVRKYFCKKKKKKNKNKEKQKKNPANFNDL